MSQSLRPAPDAPVAVHAEALSQGEREELAKHEAVIERGLKAFVEVGEALDEIRERRLYRATHTRFADYLRERWDLGNSHCYRLIDAAKQVQLVREVSPNGDTPKSEAQARELASVTNLNVRARIVERVEQGGGWGPHTAADVARIRDEETAAWQEHRAAQDEMGDLIYIRGTAATLRKTPLGVFYERRRMGWGEERADDWLRAVRDDAAFVKDQADALLGGPEVLP